MEYSSSSTHFQKMLHSIDYPSIPRFLIPKNHQQECGLSFVSPGAFRGIKAIPVQSHASRYFLKLNLKALKETKIIQDKK